VHVSLLPHTRHMPHPSYSSRFGASKSNGVLTEPMKAYRGEWRCNSTHS
jgi:hypothetical protein